MSPNVVPAVQVKTKSTPYRRRYGPLQRPAASLRGAGGRGSFYWAASAAHDSRNAAPTIAVP